MESAFSASGSSPYFCSAELHSHCRLTVNYGAPNVPCLLCGIRGTSNDRLFLMVVVVCQQSQPLVQCQLTLVHL